MLDQILDRVVPLKKLIYVEPKPAGIAARRIAYCEACTLKFGDADSKVVQARTRIYPVLRKRSNLECNVSS